MKLDDQLKSVPVPPRAPGYWEAFPRRVTARINNPPPVRPANWWPGALALATACVVIALGIGGWARSRQPQRTDSARIYREVAALFPNQVRAIVTDEHGVRLVLADQADVPRSPALLVRFCQAQRCRSVITFSGQRVRLNGESVEVLVDGRGNVLVVGENALVQPTEARVL
jgi:hypothetical protein